MKIVQARIPVAKLAQAHLPLAQIIGIAVANNNIFFMSCALPQKITEKMQANIPEWELPETHPLTFIKSVQMKGSLLVVEVEGPLTTAIKDTIDAITAKMATAGMFTGFFPASDGLRHSQCYYGNATNNLRNVAVGIENVRLMDNAASLLFTRKGDGNVLHMLPLSKMDLPWAQSSLVMHRFKQEVKFLGRMQGGKIDVVLRDNNSLRVTLREQSVVSIKSSSLLKQGATAVFGLVKAAGNDFLAALQGRELVLISATK
jgi:hypothetical protein